MSKFSSTRFGLLVRGMAMIPCWMIQRRVTWPGVLPWARPISISSGSWATLPWASGDQAVIETPSSSALAFRVFSDR